VSSVGVFDSGVGGLTVVRALLEQVPNESILYLGDTARVPYGNKSAATVTRYAENAARFLLGRGVKMLLIACNTASAYAVDALGASVAVPVLGAVEPGARAAVRASTTGRIGVLGTLGTVRSGAYLRAIDRAAAELGRSVRIAARPSPLLVPLVEEGWLEGEVPELAARRYLDELHAEAPDLDVLVLGCTHYPLLRPLLQRLADERWGRPVTLVDSAATMVAETDELLGARGLRAAPGAIGELRCALTDEARVDEVGERFLGRTLGAIERVDL
jgi:glutamate racemase